MSTFFNGAYCDLYVGKGAGKKLLQDIRTAKSSIKIVSPYLTDTLIEELQKRNDKNIEINLITTTDSDKDTYSYVKKNNTRPY